MAVFLGRAAESEAACISHTVVIMVAVVVVAATPPLELHSNMDGRLATTTKSSLVLFGLANCDIVCTQ